MSKRLRDRGKRHGSDWTPNTGMTRANRIIRSVALSRQPCEVCGGIPREQYTKVVHHSSGKVWRWPMCGPCVERLERGDLRNTMGVV